MKTILSAALLAFALSVFSPVDSSAGINGKSYNGNGYENGNNTCPNGGNNHAVPEPGTLALLGAALGMIYLRKRNS